MKHIQSAPYHPATNGLAEQFVQSLMKASQNNGPSLSHRLGDFNIIAKLGFQLKLQRVSCGEDMWII